MEPSLRLARSEDVAALTAIYNDEMACGNANYESEPQRETDRMSWLEGLQKRGFPVVAAESDGVVVGFAALTPFHSLSGYRFTVSGSIYVQAGYRRRGVGRALCRRLLEEAVERGYHCILLGINSENLASLALLESLGFRRAGHFREIGFKNGRWHDDICLQKTF